MITANDDDNGDGSRNICKDERSTAEIPHRRRISMQKKWKWKRKKRAREKIMEFYSCRRYQSSRRSLSNCIVQQALTRLYVRCKSKVLNTFCNVAVTFRNGFNPPLLQLNLFGVCIALVSSGKFHASRFVSEFEIESCSRSSSYKLPPRAADALDIIPASSQSSIFVYAFVII